MRSLRVDGTRSARTLRATPDERGLKMPRVQPARERNSLRRSTKPVEDPAKLDALRRKYFAEASETAARYGISFGQVHEHLLHARSGARRIAYDRVQHVADLVHAVACVQDVGLAWLDISQMYEPCLVRVCRSRATNGEPIVIVRRLLRDLHRRNRAPEAPDQPTIRTYIGTYPLRSWLADRVLGFIKREAGMTSRWRGRPAMQAEQSTAIE